MRYPWPMAYFIVDYTYDTTRTAEQDAVRADHRAFLGGLAERGINVASGPWVDSAPGAHIVMRGESADEVLALLDDDPFCRGGFVAERAIRQWNPVIGILAE